MAVSLQVARGSVSASQPWINLDAIVNQIFSPLDTSQLQIRVASLYPRDSVDARVRVTLQTVSLRDHPRFDALSWAWGDANDVRPILLNNQTWWAPKNLVVALEHLEPESEPRTIWIDALCINQSQTPAGLAERAHQIGLMRHVYTRAEHVLVWMGIEQEYTEGVLPFLSDVADAATPAPNKPPVLPRSFHVSYKDSSKVLHLLSQAWWVRLWTLQEVALGKSPILLHGNTQIPFHKAIFAMNLLEARGHLWDSAGQFQAKVGPFNSPEFHGFMFKNRYNNLSVMAFTSREQHFLTFATLLVACRFRSATDPRDKIFGLFGLVPDLVLHALQPRYDEPVDKTYIRTAFTLMSETRSLALLSHTTPWLRNRNGVSSAGVGIPTNLPSWVPDWTVPNSAAYRRQLPDHIGEARPFSPSHPSVSSQSTHRTHLSIHSGRHLRLQAIHIDTVAATGHGYHGLGRSLDWSRHRRRLSRVCFSSSYSSSSAAQLGSAGMDVDVLENDLSFLAERRWHDVLWACLSFAYLDALLDAFVTRRLFAALRWVNASWWTMHYWFLPGEGSGEGKGKAREAYRLRRACEERDFETMRVDKRLRVYLKDRVVQDGEGELPSTIFTTEDGFVGVGPAFMQKGDQVFHAAAAAPGVGGVVYPLVLRKSASCDTRFEFVGECFLAGLMQGEAARGDGQAVSFASWRVRRRKLVPTGERQLDDGVGVWEEVVLG